MRSANAPQISTRRDDEEHALEQHVRHHGNGQAGIERHVGAVAGPYRVDAVHQHISEIADPRAVAAEHQRIAVQPPKHGHQAHEARALHDDAEDVLLTHQAAIEQRQRRRRHEQHQRGRRQHPSVVGRTELGAAVGGMLGD